MIILLFLLLLSTNAYALTESTSEIERFVNREFLSHCEWIDTFEITTIIRHREYLPASVVPYEISPKQYSINPGPIHCATDDPEILRECHASLYMEAMKTRAEDWLTWREFYETIVSYRLQHANYCKLNCTPTPEPSSIVFVMLGILCLTVAKAIRK